jgi:hypothetical protein
MLSITGGMFAQALEEPAKMLKNATVRQAETAAPQTLQSRKKRRTTKTPKLVAFPARGVLRSFVFNGIRRVAWFTAPGTSVEVDASAEPRVCDLSHMD